MASNPGRHIHLDRLMHLTTRALLGKILTRKSSIYRQKRYTPPKKNVPVQPSSKGFCSKNLPTTLFCLGSLPFFRAAIRSFLVRKNISHVSRKSSFPPVETAPIPAGNQETGSSRHNEKPRVSAKWAQYCRLSWKFSLTLANSNQ